MTDDDHGVHVPLREFIEMAVKSETGTILTRLEAMDKAHTIQATELARRLEELNGAHARAEKDREKFVNREVHEATHLELTEWRKVVSATLSEMKGRGALTATIAAVVASIIVGILVKMWH